MKRSGGKFEFDFPSNGYFSRLFEATECAEVTEHTRSPNSENGRHLLICI